jgi:hypothetical protein
MAIKLNEAGYARARKLIQDGVVALDDRVAWSEHRPSNELENRFIDKYGVEEYGTWFLAVDDELDEDAKGHYKFPYGDFEKVHRCAVLAAESRAVQYKHPAIESACAHLHGMIETLRGSTSPEP